MSKRVKGTLVIIGGAERKDDEQTVLKMVVDRIGANQRPLYAGRPPAIVRVWGTPTCPCCMLSCLLCCRPTRVACRPPRTRRAG